MIFKTREILKVTQVILERKTSQRRQRRTLKSKSDKQGLSMSVALTPPFWVAAEPSLLIFINAGNYHTLGEGGGGQGGVTARSSQLLIYCSK